MAKEVMRRLRVAALVLSVFALGGCEKGHIFEKFKIDVGEGFSSDAQQRFIYSKTRGERTAQGAQNVVCAEPSPDVASAVASSFQAGLAAALKEPKSGIDGSVSASVASSFAQSIAQLGERTATITVLRDALFRACEAYANGALSPAAYALILSRYDVFAMTLMTSELAAGNFGRRLAALNTSTGAGAGTLGAEDQKLLDTADKEMEEAKTKVDETLKNLEAAKKAAAPDDAEIKKLDTALTQAKSNLATKTLAASTIRTALTGRTFAAAFATAGDALSAARSVEMAAQIQKFQDEYFEHTAAPSGPIYAACVSIFDNPPVQKPDDDPSLRLYRSRFMSACATLIEMLPPIAAARAMKGQPHAIIQAALEKLETAMRVQSSAYAQSDAYKTFLGKLESTELSLRNKVMELEKKVGDLEKRR